MGEEQPKTNELVNFETIQEKKYFKAEFSEEFNYFYSNVFSPEKLDLIDDFIDHYEVNGLYGWKGKISASWKVPDYYKDKDQRAKYAQKYNLWHVHIGLPTWKKVPNVPFLTSDHVLHFQKISKYKILLMTVSTHNPMDLPDID